MVIIVNKIKLITAIGTLSLTLSSANAFLDSSEIEKRINDKNFKPTTSRLPAGVIINDLDDIIPAKIRSEIDEERSFKRAGEELVFDKSIAQKVDLRHRDTKVKSQWGGTCSTFGLIASMENLIGNPETSDLSERHLWNQYKKYSSPVAIATAKNFYVTDERYWPQTNKKPFNGYVNNAHTKLVNLKDIGSSITKAVDALDRGNPVYIGMRVPQGMSSCQKVVSPTSPATKGGHALAVVGYELNENIKGGGYFIMKNSWGSRCGDNGYQYIPFYHCQRRDMYCMMWEISNVVTNHKSQFDSLPELDMSIFDEDEISISLYKKKPWYSKYTKYGISIKAPTSQFDLIKDVSYKLVNSNISGLKTKNMSSKFHWSFKSKRKSYKVVVKITLKDDRVFEKTYNI